MLKQNAVKEKIRSNKKVIGAFFNLNSTAAVEILGQLGLDFIIIDTEHGPGGVESTLPLILAAEVRGITPIVRVCEIDRTSILKMLDIGAMGLLIPYVKTVEQVKDIIQWGKYMPIGDRGYSFTRKNGYGMEDEAAEDIQEYFDWANSNTLLIPQCETVECLEHIEEITALEGVDGIFIGLFDLSISMGIPKQFSAPEFQAAVARVLAVCKKAGKFCFVLGPTPEAAQKIFEQGFDGAVTGDTSFLVSGAQQYLQGLRNLGY